MNLAQFNELKENTKLNLERKLDLSRQQHDLRYEAVVMNERKTFLVYDNDEQQSVLREMMAFAELHNGTITHKTAEKSEGRIGYYSHTVYTVKYPVLVPEITEPLVKAAVHTALKGIMKLSHWSTIKCDIMQLFKDGLIDWDAVVKSHKTDCSL